MVPEKRKHPRLKRNFDLQLHKKMHLFFKGPVNEAKMVDISKCGAKLSTDSLLASGDTVVLTIRSQTRKSTARINGKVVWIKNTATGSLHAGIEFLNSSMAQDVAVLRML